MSTRLILPLLVEPAPPTLGPQDATAQGAADLAETALWRYHLRYWHEHAAQDEVIVTVSFNIAPSDDEMNIPADDTPRVNCVLAAQLDYSDDGERIEALRLTRAHDEPGPAGRWPCADYRSSAGLIVDLGNGTGDGTVRTYAFDPPMLSEGWPGIGLIWSDLDVTCAQNARASLAVVRNRGLGDHDAPADEVVYRTATVDALDVVTPFNHWPQDIDISGLGDSVEAALDATFTALFGDRRIGQRATLGLSYGYQLLPAADSDAGPMTYLPVALYPNQPITATTATQIASTLAAWKEANNPATTGSEWLFSLVLFSQVDTRAPRSLLELGRLVYRMR
jgi:hypothetical protein